MRLHILLLVLLCSVSLVAAEEFIFDSSLYAAEWIETKTALTSEINLSGDISSFDAKLLYFPAAFPNQEVLDVFTSPDPIMVDDSLLFSWDHPRVSVSLDYQATVRSTYHRPEIREKIEFPYTYVPPEYSDFLQEQEIIRITPEISRLAAELAGDETDAFRVVFAIGQWVKDNIEYDLNTVTVEASQTSDWVLRERTGVCDELTSLFIAMLRSQGIPARFISGVAYTNLPTLDSNWGPHGWAEVWFPEVGWVPYDVTYGQFGYVDATHIFFQARPDAQSSAVEYLMRSRGGDFSPSMLTRTTVVSDRGDPVSPDVEISLEPALEEVAFGSYNRVDVEITNTRPYYVSSELFLAKTQSLTTNDYSQSILLGPNEKTTLSWIFKVEENLEQKFKYTFPVVIYTNSNQSFRTSFSASRQGTAVEDPDPLEVRQESESSPVLEGELFCDVPEIIPLEKKFAVTCTFDHAVHLCIHETCKVTDTLIETFTFDNLGVHTIVATATRDDARQQKILTVRVEDDPSLDVRVSVPNKIDAADETVLYINLSRTSVAKPENVRVFLEHPIVSDTWELGTLEKNAVLEVHFLGRQLTRGDNELVVRTLFDSGKETVENVQIAEVHVSASNIDDHILLWWNSFSAWVASFS